MAARLLVVKRSLIYGGSLGVTTAIGCVLWGSIFSNGRERALGWRRIFRNWPRIGHFARCGGLTGDGNSSFCSWCAHWPASKPSTSRTGSVRVSRSFSSREGYIVDRAVATSSEQLRTASEPDQDRNLSSGIRLLSLCETVRACVWVKPTLKPRPTSSSQWQFAINRRRVHISLENISKPKWSTKATSTPPAGPGPTTPAQRFRPTPWRWASSRLPYLSDLIWLALFRFPFPNAKLVGPLVVVSTNKKKSCWKSFRKKKFPIKVCAELHPWLFRLKKKKKKD